MLLASLLTVLALAGVTIGVLLGRPQRLSAHLSAAGAGLLLGLAAFWLLPETALQLGWPRSVLLSLGLCLLLAILDQLITHRSVSVKENVVGPLLAATAIHSFLDGWSVRAAAVGALAGIAVPLGLALHKIPEGLALGWIARRRFSSVTKALVASASVELFTLLGAAVEPRSELLGINQFGIWWTAAILAAIAGSFLFLGLHALWPARREKAALAVFAGTLVVIAFAAHWQ